MEYFFDKYEINEIFEVTSSRLIFLELFRISFGFSALILAMIGLATLKLR